LSTERFAHPFVAASGVGLLTLVASAAGVARAADVDFRPSLSFGVFHDGNLSVVGGSHGDEGAALAMDFAVDRKTAMSTLSFSYRPSYVAYRRASDLDYFGNTVVLGFAREASRSSRFNVDLYLSRTDYQGLTPDTKDTAITFVPRTTLTQGSVRVGGTIAAGRRGSVDLLFRGGVDRYDDVKDDPSTAAIETHDFNDTNMIGGRVAWRSDISPRNSLGVGLDAVRFGYEIGPAVDVETLGLVGTCQAGELWLLTYAAGGSRASRENDSISGFSFDATIAYAAGRASTFSAGARQVFAPGTGVGTSTQDRGAWVSYAHAPSARGLSGSVVGGYWQRDVLEFGSTTTGPTPPADSASFNLNGTLGWKFNRYLTLDAAYAYIDQSARNEPDPVVAASLETNYSSYGLYLRWAIRGR